MKLYTYYTASHAQFVRDWFLPSLKDDYEVVLGEGAQKSDSGAFKQGGWNATMQDKVKLILRAIEENWGKTFIYADPDIQFFAKTRPTIERHLAFKDLVIQRDDPHGELCAGFFACRANKRILKLWQDTYEFTAAHPDMDDQDSLNQILCPDPAQNATFYHQWGFNAYRLRWSYLPNSYMGGGLFSGQEWEPGKTLDVPPEIIMHHANYTKGIENKIAQLQYVQDLVRERLTRH